MLHRIVRMEQPWAYGTDLRPLDMLDHQVQPIAMDNFDIVVKKEEPWTLRLANCEIVQRGKIKRTAKMQDAMFRFREKINRSPGRRHTPTGIRPLFPRLRAEWP